jgi:hypothetical protein
MNNDIIYWIRHAESCSNFRSVGITDKIPKNYTDYGYNKIETQKLHTSHLSTSIYTHT